MSTGNRPTSSRTTTYEAIVGLALEDIRKNKRISQADVAAAVGVTQPTWSRIEKGHTALSMGQLRRAARALGTLPSRVLVEADEHAESLRAAGIRVIDAPTAATRDDSMPIAGAALAGLLLGLAVASNSK